MFSFSVFIFHLIINRHFTSTELVMNHFHRSERSAGVSITFWQCNSILISIQNRLIGVKKCSYLGDLKKRQLQLQRWWRRTQRVVLSTGVRQEDGDSPATLLPRPRAVWSQVHHHSGSHPRVGESHLRTRHTGHKVKDEEIKKKE